MKKIISIFLTVIIATSILTGCTNETKDTVSKGNSSVNSTNEEKKENEDKKDDKKQDADKASYKQGTWEGNNYKNESLNMNFTLPEGWSKIDNDKAKEILEAKLGNDADSEAVKDMNFYDFFIKNDKTGTNIQLLIADASLMPGGNEMTSKIYLDSVIAQFDALKESGYTCSEVKNNKMCNQDYLSCTIKMPQSQGINCEYNIQKQGKYVISFVGTYGVANKTEYDSFINSLKSVA